MAIICVLCYNNFGIENKNKYCMVKENIAVKSFKFVLKDIVLDILYWPVWWYTAGTVKMFKKMLMFIDQGNSELGVTIWVKNIFVPMFGQYDWQSRIISFFVRLFNVIFRAIVLLFWVIIGLIIFLFWVLLPIFLVIMLLLNLGIFI